MGISIAYRGRLADLTRIEDFEDRLLDFALEVGGLAQIWRSYDDEDPRRVIRGVILHLAPGQESASLLLSPEGWLIGLLDIEDAERGRLTEPPWCFVKTQFGSLEGHVALVEMFTALKRDFLPDLEVSDEGGYWETRDLTELARKHAVVQGAIDGLAEGLRRHGLSREAAEDPDILVRRIERIAAQVHRILQRPAEHPPVTFSEEEAGGVPDPEATEALWDEMYKHNRRQQERLQRALEGAAAVKTTTRRLRTRWATWDWRCPATTPRRRMSRGTKSRSRSPGRRTARRCRTSPPLRTATRKTLRWRPRENAIRCCRRRWTC
jgi:hypothetical protein